MSTFLNMTLVFSVNISLIRVLLPREKTYSNQKSHVMIHVGSLRDTAGTPEHQAEHIPEGRRIPLLIAAMGCWE